MTVAAASSVLVSALRVGLGLLSKLFRGSDWKFSQGLLRFFGGSKFDFGFFGCLWVV